jgi:catechol-2,3-dioxygenase
MAYFVVRTSRFAEMIAWYKMVLNATPGFENESIAFLAYDDEPHRVAFINIPDLAEQPEGICGLHLVAFTYNSLSEFLDNHARLRNKGLLPLWPVNHGPTTSLLLRRSRRQLAQISS